MSHRVPAVAGQMPLARPFYRDSTPAMPQDRTEAVSASPAIPARDPSGERDPQAFLCTDLDRDPLAVLGRFVFRRRIETTFQEVREQLGVETQRQWSDLTILGTTPALLGLYSPIALWAHALLAMPDAAVRPQSKDYRV